LATVYFSSGVREQVLYIDSMWVSSDSFLEFDTRGVGSPVGAYVYTGVDPRYFIDRIGFYDKALVRYGANFKYRENGLYQIYMDKARDWNPPMVPEPSAYGAALLGMGLGAVVLNRRRVKKGRAASVRSTREWRAASQMAHG